MSTGHKRSAGARSDGKRPAQRQRTVGDDDDDLLGSQVAPLEEGVPVGSDSASASASASASTGADAAGAGVDASVDADFEDDPFAMNVACAPPRAGVVPPTNFIDIFTKMHQDSAARLKIVDGYGRAMSAELLPKVSAEVEAMARRLFYDPSKTPGENDAWIQANDNIMDAIHDPTKITALTLFNLAGRLWYSVVESDPDGVKELYAMHKQVVVVLKKGYTVCANTRNMPTPDTILFVMFNAKKSLRLQLPRLVVPMDATAHPRVLSSAALATLEKTNPAAYKAAAKTFADLKFSIRLAPLAFNADRPAAVACPVAYAGMRLLDNMSRFWLTDEISCTRAFNPAPLNIEELAKTMEAIVALPCEEVGIASGTPAARAAARMSEYLTQPMIFEETAASRVNTKRRNRDKVQMAMVMFGLAPSVHYQRLVDLLTRFPEQYTEQDVVNVGLAIQRVVNSRVCDGVHTNGFSAFVKPGSESGDKALKSMQSKVQARLDADAAAGIKHHPLLIVNQSLPTLQMNHAMLAAVKGTDADRARYMDNWVMQAKRDFLKIGKPFGTPSANLRPSAASFEYLNTYVLPELGNNIEEVKRTPGKKLLRWNGPEFDSYRVDETGETVLVDITPTVDMLQAGTQAGGEITYSSYSTGVGGNSGTKPSFFGLSIMRKPKQTYRSLTAGEERLNTTRTIRPGSFDIITDMPAKPKMLEITDEEAMRAMDDFERAYQQVPLLGNGAGPIGGGAGAPLALANSPYHHGHDHDHGQVDEMAQYADEE